MNETIVITNGASQEEFQKFLTAIEKRTDDTQPKNQMEWIEVTPETMPPKDTAIIVSVKSGIGENGDQILTSPPIASIFHGGEFVGMAWTDDRCFNMQPFVKGIVTHWMPWPEPPIKEAK